MAFLTVMKHFYSVLGLNNLRRVRVGGRTPGLFVIPNAVLCALKCIFVPIDSLLRHISTTLF